MKILRFLQNGSPVYGILERDTISPCHGDPFEGLQPRGESLELSSVQLLPPVSPPNVICLGLNYKRHAREFGLPHPEKPLIFLKTTTAVCGPGDAIVLPEHNPEEIDYEAELAIIIGKKTRNVTADRALEHVLGYTVANDVTNRAAQAAESQWARAKSYDTFCPLGPVIATDVDGDNLPISCRVDGQLMQSSNTADMFFSCPEIVAYLSQCMTLLPGTVILTGTPEGVGFKRTPPVFLREGQLVECEITGIGKLANPVKRHAAAAGSACN
ncbi:MAG: fumarylacetoacetate hydrolase family protein [Deltaproteobacteria bacterium]|nr:fumarylacetoacetate hydrolase family protein [Deltaproteobacteria bacterium]MBW2072521.1 fumarylacetoacetate hydrolase family protein [Deltaproteobacteria bacterium]